MKSFKQIISIARAGAYLCFMLALAAGCQDINDGGETPPPPFNYSYCMRFTDDPIEENNPIEYIYCNAETQTVTLRLHRMTDPSVPRPLHFHFQIAYYDKYDNWNTGEFDELLNLNEVETKDPQDFYKIWRESEGSTPLLKVCLDRNNTGKQRELMLIIVSDQGYDPINHTAIAGKVRIIQDPETENYGTFSLKAKYKDKLYTTEAEFDSDGNYVFHNSEYADLMNRIDADPTVQMVIFDNNTINYYDDQDISRNKIYQDILSLEQKPADESQTRGSGFEDFDSSYLGYVSLHDNDHFGGKKLSKGLTNFHFTWNLPNLKDYGMNDKVTSIAAAFNHDSPLICTVLTIWDDADFNHGDNYRKKHRLSVIASKFAPRVTLDDLKKIKKIGSSKSWNDCISSISFHFGYLDTPLLDY